MCPHGRDPALVKGVRQRPPRGLEKHYRPLARRLGAPRIRELLAAFRRDEVSAAVAADQLGLGRARCYELYADYLHTTAHSPTTLWTPGTSGGNHAPDWPAGVEPLLRKLLAAARAAQREARSVVRPAPRCPWGPHIWSVRTAIKVGPDGRVPISRERLRAGVAAGTRVIHCLQPNGTRSILAHAPKAGERPALLLQIRAT